MVDRDEMAESPVAIGEDRSVEMGRDWAKAKLRTVDQLADADANDGEGGANGVEKTRLPLGQ